MRVGASQKSHSGRRPSTLVMKLCGWKTDAMFRRYAIVDERDLREAVELLAKGKMGGQSVKQLAKAMG